MEFILVLVFMETAGSLPRPHPVLLVAASPLRCGLALILRWGQSGACVRGPARLPGWPLSREPAVSLWVLSGQL